MSVLDQVRSPIVSQAKVNALAAIRLMSADVEKVAERVRTLRIEVVTYIQVELRIDRVQHVQIQEIGIERCCCLQKIILPSARCGEIRRRNEREQPVCCAGKGQLLATARVRRIRRYCKR